ncbi:Non-structural maintenance of chromosomes element 4 -like protein B [Capsicum annuum]|uniref:non-structural maintenance of chromosomes element 4 homolog A-like n=1 Tax=Capsicum annuum TaxID=4072 RepID=UPI001FB0ECCB|nr:non-structural maintenance of chromosomes element 4 homolog A-like [Capsicum annuum]KAF3662680.1 Non-structural maintenance of chromosomes element 4 -like protein B [Capsicum annuum]KAF3668949.1 Non-structural maintenance of chromosomes element 4 -like protein B [Capsicum annuum]
MANRMPKVELSNGFTEQPKSQARGVRCKYYAIQNSISDGKDDIGSVDSKKFKEIMKEIETSHNEVKKPREQVADAEALFDLARTLVTSVRSHNTDGITPYMFISSLLRVYGSRSAKRHSQNANTLRWKKIGHAVSPIFGNARGCHTMIGPMDRKVKQRKYTRRPRSQLYLRARPKELDFNTEEITDTDKNIATMFQILKKEKRVKLENLVLNRKCFAQTIENLFALSFLVKDGRVVIHVDENRSHFLSPRNGPAARLVMSGEVKYSHFVFRLDFVDWELMKKAVPEGEELMPNRVIMASPVFTEANKPNKDTSTNPVFTEAYKLVPVEDSRLRLRITRVKKMSRNHGKVLREASDIDNSPEIGDANIGNGSLKRKLL